MAMICEPVPFLKLVQKFQLEGTSLLWVFGVKYL